jgi:neurofibromin 1
VLPYSDIDDVTGETDRLTVKHGSETITFVSRPDPRSGSSDASRTTLRKLESDLRSARARLTPSQRTLRPNDVPGTLLNIALLNLHSPDETLRCAAYGLLHEIGTFFRYDFGLIKASRKLPVKLG